MAREGMVLKWRPIGLAAFDARGLADALCISVSGAHRLMNGPLWKPRFRIERQFLVRCEAAGEYLKAFPGALTGTVTKADAAPPLVITT